MEPFRAPPGQPQPEFCRVSVEETQGDPENPHSIHTSGDQGITAPHTVLRASLTLTTQLRDEEASLPEGGRDPTFSRRAP